MQFVDGGSNLGSPVSLDGSGNGTLMTSALTVGSHSITAIYSGNANFTASSSGTLIEIVNPYDSITHTWTGGGDANWTTAANWSNGVLDPLDSLIFPPGAAQTTASNDFPADTTFGLLNFSGGGYSISGSSVLLTGGIKNSIPVGQSNQLALNVGFASPTTSIEDDGGDLTIQGTVTSSGALTVTGSGTLQATSITGSGSTTVAAGANLQVNCLKQYMLSLSPGSVVVLGDPTGAAGSPNTDVGNDSAADSPTASMDEAAADAANVATTVVTSAPPVVGQAFSSAAVGGGVLFVSAGTSSSELGTAQNPPIVPGSASLVIGEHVASANPAPSMVSGQTISAGLTTGEIVVPACITGSQLAGTATGVADSPSPARAYARAKQIPFVVVRSVMPVTSIGRSDSSVGARGTLAMPKNAGDTAQGTLPTEEKLLLPAIGYGDSVAAASRARWTAGRAEYARAYDAALAQGLLESSSDDMSWLPDVQGAGGNRRSYGSLWLLASSTDSVLATYGDAFGD